MKTIRIVATYLAIMFAFSYPASVEAQQAPQPVWQKCYGGSDNDANVDGYQYVIKTSDGGFIFLAGTTSADNEVTCNHSINYDIWVVKLTSNLDIQWQRCLGGSGTEIPYSIIQTFDSGYCILAHTTSNDGDVTDSGQFDNIDSWIVKLDSDGIIEWDTRIGGNKEDFLYSVVQTADGGYIAAGHTWSTDAEMWPNHGLIDAFVVKLTPTGKLEWRKLYGGSYLDAANAILQTTEGNYIFVGSTMSPNDGDVQGVHGESNGSYVAPDIWVVNLDTDGRIQRQQCYGGSGKDVGYSMVASGDGGYVIAGITDSADGDVSKHYWNPDPINDEDVWILKIDENGKLIWQSTVGGTENDKAVSIIRAQEGSFVFCGHSYSSDGDVSGLRLSGPDVWIGALSSEGKLQWQTTIGGTHVDFGYTITQTEDKGFMVYATTKSNDGDVSGNHGESDVWLVKLSPVVGAVNAGPSSSNFAHPYPNPSDREMSLELYYADSVNQIKFFNLMGTEFYPEYRINNTSVTVDLHSLPVGMYIIRVTYTGNPPLTQIRKFMHIADVR